VALRPNQLAGESLPVAQLFDVSSHGEIFSELGLKMDFEGQRVKLFGGYFGHRNLTILMFKLIYLLGNIVVIIGVVLKLALISSWAANVLALGISIVVIRKVSVVELI
jgi:hypothetical protein